MVILSIHWGREHQPTPARSQLELGREMAKETGIDLIIGHHAHVVQPMEKVDGTWIAYGLGNQLARHDVPSGLTEEGAIGWFEFHKKSGGGWDVAGAVRADLRHDPAGGRGRRGRRGRGRRGRRAIPTPPRARAKDHRLLDIAGGPAAADKGL